MRLLPEDGIFDELAVEIAVSGRQVALTARERNAAVLMCSKRLGLARWIIAERLGISQDVVDSILKSAGPV
jgi:DNA-binding CsgD family transcriptional regulator